MGRLLLTSDFRLTWFVYNFCSSKPARLLYTIYNSLYVALHHLGITYVIISSRNWWISYWLHVIKILLNIVKVLTEITMAKMRLYQNWKAHIMLKLMHNYVYFQCAACTMRKYPRNLTKHHHDTTIGFTTV